MGVWFARSSHQPSTIQAASQVQPTTANQEKVTTPPDMAVTLTPVPLTTACFSALKPDSGSGWENKGLTTWALLLTQLIAIAFILVDTHPRANASYF
ncbi:MAG: hypothetical protein KME05_23075 [Gloeocapsa sp. UFS-A4-WI-NPMV-4B04]|jgi:hypothetical protein|nr:hypothetical protein [Gloeocapsa sp. UFS-A4-WI-NPMV-4B04]